MMQERSGWLYTRAMSDFCECGIFAAVVWLADAEDPSVAITRCNRRTRTDLPHRIITSLTILITYELAREVFFRQMPMANGPQQKTSYNRTTTSICCGRCCSDFVVCQGAHSDAEPGHVHVRRVLSRA